MNANLVKAVLAIAVMVAILAAGIGIGRRTPSGAEETAAQAPASRAVPAVNIPTIQRDPYQRSLAIYELKKAAASGADRGREIFYYKCWFCHNEFAGPQSAPALKTVYQRKQLLSGRPTTDDGIKDEIRNGGGGMAAYKYVLSDADLADLVAYLREKCCWDSNSPPPNPRYRFASGESE